MERTVEKNILKRMDDQKILLLFGTKLVGKTTTMKHLLNGKNDVLWLDGDNPQDRARIESHDASITEFLRNGRPVMVIDEAHYIEHLGIRLKHYHDTYPAVKIVASGSSSVLLSRSTMNTLAGMKWEFCLYTLAFEELVKIHGEDLEKRMLPHRLVYGTYPEIVSCVPGDEKHLLVSLKETILDTEVLDDMSLKDTPHLMRLLRSLARNVDRGISISDLSHIFEMPEDRLEESLHILEKASLIFSLPVYCGNHWNEMKNGRKFYFYDNGLRNAVLLNFCNFRNRKDRDILWRNYLISERKKYLSNHGIVANTHFWQTNPAYSWQVDTRQEVSYIEDRMGEVSAYEFSWSKAEKVESPPAFRYAYPEVTFTVINRDNFNRFLSGAI